MPDGTERMQNLSSSLCKRSKFMTGKMQSAETLALPRPEYLALLTETEEWGALGVIYGHSPCGFDPGMEIAGGSLQGVLCRIAQEMPLVNSHFLQKSSV